MGIIFAVLINGDSLPGFIFGKQPVIITLAPFFMESFIVRTEVSSVAVKPPQVYTAIKSAFFGSLASVKPLLTKYA
jgi:hypothetical protein